SGTTDENGEEATFTVRLSSQPSDNDSSTADNVTITVEVSDPSEALLVSAKKLVFDQANWNSPQTVTVRGVYDNVSDGDQPFTVVLKDNVTSDNRFRYVDPPDVSMTNLDLTDKGTFYISGVTGTTDENENNEAWFTVRLSSQPQDNDTTNDPDNVTITVTVPDSTEAELLEPADGELMWLSTDWNTAKTVKVRGVSDDIADGDQSYSVILGADNNSPDRRFRYVDPPDVTLTNLDLTNKGTFYISGVSGTTDENGEEATFTVRLS
ncbi:uncharacterized protein METZ01_LOCUS432039, partial [marine metagenome]